MTQAARAVRVGATASVLAAAAIATAGSPGALAARLPTRGESRALARAFARDRRHPRGARIFEVKVSTARGWWAQVKWIRPPRTSSRSRAARAARAKIINVSNYQGPARHPRPTSRKPPVKAQKDLDRDLYAQLRFSLAGSENASKQATFPDENTACPDDSSQMTVTDDVGVTETWRFDWDRGVPDGGDLVFVGRPVAPFFGSRTEQASEHDYEPASGDCPGYDTKVTCQLKQGVSKQIRSIVLGGGGGLLPYRGILLGPVLDAGQSGCDNGQSENMVVGSRYNTDPLVFSALAPFKIAGAGGSDIDYGPFTLGFPHDGYRRSEPAASSTLGICKDFSGGSCTDRVEWTAKAQIVAS